MSFLSLGIVAASVARCARVSAFLFCGEGFCTGSKCSGQMLRRGEVRSIRSWGASSVGIMAEQLLQQSVLTSTKSLHCASTHEHNNTPLPFLFRGSGQPSVASRTGDQRGDHGGWLALVAVLLVPALVGDERPSENLSVDLLNERPPQLSG